MLITYKSLFYMYLTLGRRLYTAGQPLSKAHFRTSRCPPLSAQSQVRSSQGQPWDLAHYKTSRRPSPAVQEQVYQLHIFLSMFLMLKIKYISSIF